MFLFLQALIFVALILIATFFSTTLFISAGYIFSLILPLSLFQSSILCVASAFVCTFFIVSFSLLKDATPRKSYYDYEAEEEEEEDDDDDQESEIIIDQNYSNKRFTVVNTTKVGRNEQCPCGSGKKYKNCCGR